MAAVPPDPTDALEDLLAEALARFDEGGEAALAAFVREHPEHASRLERGLQRCRQMGLLGTKAAAKPSEPPERLGEFRLVRRIGAGGMGVVYEAVQEPLGRRVALKIIRPELLYFEGARERFRREVDAIAKLEHPAIVSVYSAGEHEGVPFFTMEMIDGITVEAVCTQLRDRRPAELRGEDLRALLPQAEAAELFTGSWWEAAVRIAHQVALGLRHAHLRGIVHRDIKPSNVIVTPHGQSIVLDFGVAQVRAAADLTRSGSAPGSPAFMSPEQRRGQATDERTDVFSLAATLWQLLTLQRPFRELDHLRVVEDLPKLRTLHAAAPAELDLVLRTAMDPERDRRYGDMEAFAADLQHVLDRRPIAARPLGLGLRLVRWTQRHRAAAATIGISLVAATVVLAVVVVVQRAARTALSAEQALTRQSLDTSLEALHELMVRLGNEKLLGVPQADEVAHGVLLDAVKLFRGLLERHPGDDDVRWRGARSIHALANSQLRRGEAGAGLASLREALAVLGSGPLASPTLLDIRAHVRKTLAGTLADGPDRAAAGEAIDAAEADLVALAAYPQRRAESLRARAELCTARSVWLDERTHPADVERELRRAIELHRECMAVGPASPRDPSLRVLRIVNLGRFLERQGRFAEARPVLVEAEALARELPEADTWPPPSLQRAETQDALASLLSRIGEDGVEPMFRDSIAAREQSLVAFPSHLEFRIRLGGTLHNYATWLWRQERFDEALPLLERARDLQVAALATSPGDAMARQFLGNHLDWLGSAYERQKDGERVLATARQLEQLGDRGPMAALRTARLFGNAWLFLGKRDATLIDAMMAQLLAAERQGLTSAQLPAKDFEPLKERDEYWDWRERVGAVPAAKQPGK